MPLAKTGKHISKKFEHDPSAYYRDYFRRVPKSYYFDTSDGEYYYENLAAEVSALTQLPYAEAMRLSRTIFQVITNTLRHGEHVRIRGIGTLVPITRGSRRVIRFHPSNYLVSLINKAKQNDN